MKYRATYFIEFSFPERNNLDYDFSRRNMNDFSFYRRYSSVEPTQENIEKFIGEKSDYDVHVTKHYTDRNFKTIHSGFTWITQIYAEEEKKEVEKINLREFGNFIGMMFGLEVDGPKLNCGWYKCE
jgi:hypothetical protein